MRSIRSMFVLAVVVGVTVVLTVACGDKSTPSSPSAVSAVGGAPATGGAVSLAAKADKVDVCHVTGNGSYHLIDVNGNALQAHLGHGDSQIGGAVPGMEGYVFGAGCVPEQDDTDGDGVADYADNCPLVPNPDQELVTYYVDQDGDGYGAGLERTACVLPAEASLIGGDTDDTNNTVYPGSTPAECPCWTSRSLEVEMGLTQPYECQLLDNYDTPTIKLTGGHVIYAVTQNGGLDLTGTYGGILPPMSCYYDGRNEEAAHENLEPRVFEACVVMLRATISECN